MSDHQINRRRAIQFLGATAGLAVANKADATMITSTKEKSNFTYCLNLATIRGHKLGFVKELETASKAGFHSVEIWFDTFQDYLKAGGTIVDTKKMLGDLGIKVENSISFNQWIMDDDTARKKEIEQMKRDMDQLAEIGCKRIAATGKGISTSPYPNLDIIAERYRTVLELSSSNGVIPQLEMWGFMKNMSNVSEVLYMAMQTGNKSARILLDIYHLYKGQTPLDTLSFMDPMPVEILHMNDHPANLSYQVITDADRVYPGDGVAPIKRILQTLGRHNHPLVLSVEVFNKNYYSQDALVVAKTALSKLKKVVEHV
ncbi:MAG TPA: sugar phosphate isomerase/epimerase family protein [Mucilaginibacter sp.]|jgi:sugar phosphate isomerase/epimerase